MNKKGLFVTIRFWTEFLDENGKKEYREKEGWESGFLYLPALRFHNIKTDSNSRIFFNSIEEIPSKLNELLRRKKVKLHFTERKKRKFTKRVKRKRRKK